MANNENVTIRLDAESKIELERIAGQLGVNLSNLFVIYARAVIREQGIPFPVTLGKIMPYSGQQSSADDDRKQ